MKPTELRLGNLFNYKKSHSLYQGKIYCINYTTVTIGNDFERNTVKTVVLIPIPITEEWLLKFGFYKWETDEGVYDDYFKHDKLFPQLAAFYLPYFHMNLYVGGITVQHVHQLQNLFFAITGQELELKNEI